MKRQGLMAIVAACFRCVPALAACCLPMAPSFVFGEDESVCARVKIEIQQQLTLERQAFDAHMRINNGLDQISVEKTETTPPNNPIPSRS